MLYFRWNYHLISALDRWIRYYIICLLHRAANYPEKRDYLKEMPNGVSCVLLIEK